MGFHISFQRRTYDMDTPETTLHIDPDLGAPMIVRRSATADRYEVDHCSECGDGAPVIEFYDRRYAGEPGFPPYGQFIRGYCAQTLLADENGGLILSDQVPQWAIDPPTMARVRAWLRTASA